jgi:2-polyprenyl-3-methyl-5-hydroxy-6-metoxy-1,4-benzoquinol methylase
MNPAARQLPAYEIQQSRKDAESLKFEFSARATDCPVCTRDIALWRMKRAAGTKFQIDRCRGCGFAFVNPRPALASLQNYYRSTGIDDGVADAGDALRNERRYPNSLIDAKRIIHTVRAMCGDTVERPALLDVGAGYGFFTREAQSAGFDVTAIELGTKAARICREMTGVEPVNTLFEEFDSGGRRFNAIVLSQVLEHVYDVNVWIEKARSLLAPQGVLAVALPNFGSLFRRILAEREPFITPPEHLNFFAAESLEMLLARHGLAVKTVEYVSRIPRRGLETRLGRLPGGLYLAGGAHLTLGYALRTVDALCLGQMITVYAS